ncbi:MAG: hypothetical protein HC893_01735 [Chloroflexaceae bacterium]|nr:hypothetical protein [Chloroflexaceae bacterium]NJL32798.1 hypothetical protein [Chloroflexaceae bacterium]NJO06310.1 hypothetical protein [Chloroflexaceae bacterium]
MIDDEYQQMGTRTNRKKTRGMPNQAITRRGHRMDWRIWEYCIAICTEWDTDDAPADTARQWGVEVYFPNDTRTRHPFTSELSFLMQELVFLNSMGSLGWELVNHEASPPSIPTTQSWIFKRPAEG